MAEYSSSSEYEDGTDSESDENYGMVENICQRLINRVWRSYASDLDKAPKEEGIYTIGYKEKYMYVGHSRDIQRRLKQHKNQDLKIDEFIREKLDGGENLQVKWVPTSESTCAEGQYLKCMAKKLKYWPPYNMKRGNTCK